MNENDLKNKLNELETRIKTIEEKVKKYYAEKRDSSSRDSMIDTGTATHEDDHPEHRPSKEQVSAEITSFNIRYDAQNIQNLRDLLARSPNAPTTQKSLAEYRKRIAKINHYAEIYGLEKLVDLL